MILLFCDSVIDPKQVEPDYEQEYQTSKALGFKTLLFSLEELNDGTPKAALKYIPTQDHNTKAIYRGWMLTPIVYTTLYNALLHKNITLQTTPQAYTHCHYLPETYTKIKAHTPKTLWTTDVTPNAITALAKPFGNTPIIVKDYVKSEKHHWEDACYIPDASNTTQVHKVVNRFLELRGRYLNKGIVFRQFETLEHLTTHSKSGMPLTKEYRLFFFNNTEYILYKYWDEGDYKNEIPDLKPFLELAKTIESSFFTMDIAKKENGEWIIMEIGDAQVSGLPEHANIQDFYSKIQQTL